MRIDWMRGVAISLVIATSGFGLSTAFAVPLQMPQRYAPGFVPATAANGVATFTPRYRFRPAPPPASRYAAPRYRPAVVTPAPRYGRGYRPLPGYPATGLRYPLPSTAAAEIRRYPRPYQYRFQRYPMPVGSGYPRYAAPLASYRYQPAAAPLYRQPQWQPHRQSQWQPRDSRITAAGPAWGGWQPPPMAYAPPLPGPWGGISPARYQQNYLSAYAPPPAVSYPAPPPVQSPPVRYSRGYAAVQRPLPGSGYRFRPLAPGQRMQPMLARVQPAQYRQDAPYSFRPQWSPRISAYPGSAGAATRALRMQRQYQFRPDRRFVAQPMAAGSGDVGYQQMPRYSSPSVAEPAWQQPQREIGQLIWRPLAQTRQRRQEALAMGDPVGSYPGTTPGSWSDRVITQY